MGSIGKETERQLKMQLPSKPLTSTIEAIGNTPLVELFRLTEGIDGRILAKLENLNPGYSKKDRIARQIIEDAETSGTLNYPTVRWAG